MCQFCWLGNRILLLEFRGLSVVVDGAGAAFHPPVFSYIKCRASLRSGGWFSFDVEAVYVLCYCLVKILA